MKSIKKFLQLLGLIEAPKPKKRIKKAAAKKPTKKAAPKKKAKK